MKNRERKKLNKEIIEVSNSILDAYTGDKNSPEYKSFENFCDRLVEGLSDENKAELFYSENAEEVSDLYIGLMRSHEGHEGIANKDTVKPYKILLSQIRPDLGDSVVKKIDKVQMGAAEGLKMKVESHERKVFFDEAIASSLEMTENVLGKGSSKRLSSYQELKLGVLSKNNEEIPEVVKERLGDLNNFKKEALEDLKSVFGEKGMDELLNAMSQNAMGFEEGFEKPDLDMSEKLKKTIENKNNNIKNSGPRSPRNSS